jgi:hypothetical protein
MSGIVHFFPIGSFDLLAFTQFCSHSHSHNLTPLEIKGADLVMMLMTPNWILKAFNLLHDFRPAHLPCFINLLFDFFTFHVTEERICH